MSGNMKKSSLFLCVCLVSLPSVLWAQKSAEDLLSLMHSAATELVFTGKAVYQQGSDLSVLQISQQRTEGGVEKSVYLDGDDTETPVKTFVMSGHAQQQSNEAYSFDLGKIERVADYNCQVVVARPKDRLRYLYRYCIEPTTGMLLKYSLTGADRKLVEQVVFTEIAIDDAKMTESFSSPVQAMALMSRQIDTTNEASSNHWKINGLPIGFKKTHEITKGKQQWQVVVSDGMTSVSIFIKPWDGKAKDNVSYSSGAMNILTQKIDQYMITSMGDVPESTLKTINQGLKYVQP